MNQQSEFDRLLKSGLDHLAANRPELAVTPLHRATEMAPANAAAIANLGAALYRSGQFEEATHFFERAVRAEPQVPVHHINLAMAYLARGQFERAWEQFAWRHQWSGFARFAQNVGRAEWQGEDLAGKTILVHGFQGFGDMLHLVRYVPLLADRGARVALACPNELRRLLAGTRGISRLIGPGEAPGEFDTHCPLMALPLAFGTTLRTIPAAVPYVAAPSDALAAWKTRVAGAGAGLKVGLVWAGSATQVLTGERSMSPELLAPLLAVENVTFFSLQKGDSVRQLAGAGQRVIDYSSDLGDFAETAALLGNLDLLITVDTAAAHLAGAMGAPVWTLLPFAADWRWMQHRADSPWYPSMRLFRQPAPGQWEQAIARAAAELRALAGAHRP